MPPSNCIHCPAVVRVQWAWKRRLKAPGQDGHGEGNTQGITTPATWSWRDEDWSWRVPSLQFRICHETFTIRCPRAVTKHAEKMKDQISSLKCQRLLHGQWGLSLDTQLLFPLVRLVEGTPCRITESQNYLSWKGLSKIIPWAGTPSTRPGYSKPHPTQP